MDHLNVADRKHDGLIGVGGIGWGTVFAVNGSRTLGREESRSGRFLDRMDYCKLHIIAHYVQTLLGPDFETVPLGKVGADDAGERLIGEMREAGIRVDRVRRIAGAPTLYSFCLVYPDESGGNLTTDNSACAQVDAAFVEDAADECARLGNRGIALAAPEVPMAAREALLALATEHGLFRVAAFNSDEMRPALDAGLLAFVDLLAVNLDEAAAAAGRSPEGEPGEIVAAAVDALEKANREMCVSITAGADGSWLWDGAALHHVRCFEAEVAGTAGAGDAHLAGLLVGHAVGLTLPEAQELAALVAALSVTSPHTINKDVSRASLLRFASESGAALGASVQRLLNDRGDRG